MRAKKSPRRFRDTEGQDSTGRLKLKIVVDYSPVNLLPHLRPRKASYRNWGLASGKAAGGITLGGRLSSPSYVLPDG